MNLTELSPLTSHYLIYHKKNKKMYLLAILSVKIDLGVDLLVGQF